MWAAHETLRFNISDFHDLCESEHIQYWIHSGTLLGSVRNGDIIPFDDDIDVSVHLADIEKLQKACECKGLQWWKHVDGLYKIGTAIPGICIDVFPVVQQGTRLVYMGTARKLFPEEFSLDDTFSRKFNLGRIRCGDTYMPVVLNGPDYAEVYLEDVYGAGWRNPKVTHAHTWRGIRDTQLYGYVMGVCPVMIVLFAVLGIAHCSRTTQDPP